MSTVVYLDPEQTAELAKARGLTVVMDACLGVELATLQIPKRTAPTR